MRRCRRALAWAALAGVAACGPQPDASAEVAGELRALRLALRQAPATDPERAAMQAAVAAVAQTQQQLLERQAALQSELARWSQLVAQDAAGERSAEAKALAAKVAALGDELQQQKVRHAELEAVLRQTLDRAADRIDALLERTGAPTPTPAASPTSTSGSPAPAAAPSPAPGPTVGGDRAAGGEDAATAGVMVRSAAFDPRLLWAGIAAAGVATVTYLVRARPTGDAPFAVRRRGRDDEGVPNACIPAFTALAEAPAPGRSGAPATGFVPGDGECLVVTAARAPAVLAALAAEPLVLRQPAPACHANGAAGAVEVRYWLAPGASAAASLRLRQRLHAAK